MKLLIRKYLTGGGSRDEQQKLLDWLREKDNLSEFQASKAGWEKKHANNPMPLASQTSWNAIQQQLLAQAQSRLKKTKTYLRIFKYAALVLIVFSVAAVSMYLSGRSSATQEFYTMVKADPGQIVNIILPDQTQVWLNSDSYIRYSNNFCTKNRDIELVGEAYFDVVKNAKLPLVVNCQAINVKVLGTKFNVSAYPDDNNFNVILEEGTVELTSSEIKDFRHTMKPREMASLDKQTNELQLKKVNVDLYTSWKEGLINIYNLPLEELVIKLSKRYNQKFQLDNELKHLRYTYTIKNESLSDILKLMETITPVEVVQKGDIIQLKNKKQK